MRILILTGFRKNVKEGQILTATINGREVDRDNMKGQYLTDMASRYSNCWYLGETECVDGDVIVIEAKTGIRQKGQDERRTFRMTYRVSDKAPIQTIEVPNVGVCGFPLLKGRVEEVASVSKADERRQSAESMLDGEF